MVRQTGFDTRKKQEKAILIGLITPNQKQEQSEEYLEELAFLTLTAGARVVKRFTQRLPHPDRKYYLGSGKLEEIGEFVKAQEIDIVIFDDELSPSQLRNLEQSLKVKILDRSNLILDIFATRARYGFPCSRALGQLQAIRQASAPFLNQSDAQVRVLSFSY